MTGASSQYASRRTTGLPSAGRRKGRQAGQDGGSLRLDAPKASLDRLQQECQVRHYSPSTFHAYATWVRKKVIIQAPGVAGGPVENANFDKRAR